MVKSEVVECKLPKGRKWSDKEVIKETSPYCTRYGGQLYQYRNYESEKQSVIRLKTRRGNRGV